MFRRSRPLLCSTATGVSFGAQHPTGRTAWVGCAASAKITASSADIPRLCGNPEKPLANRSRLDSTVPMIPPRFRDSESRRDLIELARDGSAAHRLARRANALVLLDDGMSCASIAKVLFLDDDTLRTWYRLYEEDGIEGLTSFNQIGRA